MPVINEKFQIHTNGFTDIIDITKNVQNSVYMHSLKDASVLCYVSGSTARLQRLNLNRGY